MDLNQKLAIGIDVTDKLRAGACNLSDTFRVPHYGIPPYKCAQLASPSKPHKLALVENVT